MSLPPVFLCHFPCVADVMFDYISLSLHPSRSRVNIRIMKNKRIKKYIGAGILGVMACASPCEAQISQGDITSPLAPGYMATASQMVRENNPAGCIDQLKRLIFTDRVASESEKVWFLMADASYQRGEKTALETIREYLKEFPSSANSAKVTMLEGNLLFFRGDYAEARSVYLSIDESRLDASMRDAYLYRLAFCRLKTGEYDASSAIFRRLVSNKKYSLPARFYLAYTDYAEGNLSSALKAMTELKSAMKRNPQVKDDPELYPSVIDPDYYIAQILFSRGDYAESARISSSLLKAGADQELRPEMLRVAGESYFKLGDKREASKYLNEYLSDSSTAHIPSAIYAAGTIAYDENDLQKASSLFGRLTDAPGQIAQGSYLYIGQIAMKQGDSSEAAICFEKAYKMGFDSKVAETALYNYAVARLEGGNVPFSSSAPMLETFVRTFPESKYVGQVKQYLASVYFNEKDYAKALSNAEAVRNPDRQTLGIKQKSLYRLGVEAASNSRWKEAAGYMRRCAEMGSPDKDLARQALLWEGEALYSAGDFAESERVLKRYLNSSSSGADQALGLYDLAYSLYMQDKYKDALGYFRKASSSANLPETMRSDALVRLGDCTYYCGDWRKAAELYSKARTMTGNDDGYLAMRQATMKGLGGDTAGEIEELRKMISANPNSKWMPQAMSGLAAAYSRAGDTKNAASTYRSLINSTGDSPEARKASLSLALLYGSNKMNSDAEKVYRDIISKWPASEEARTADQDLRRLYAADGRLDEYLDFITSIPGAPRPENSEMEKLAFESAESVWLDDIAATTRLEEFVEKYPQSEYTAAALLDLAVAAEDAEQWDVALNRLNSILSSRADSPQAPEALSRKASILEKHFPTMRKEALQTYRELLSRGGMAFTPTACAGIMRLTDSPAESLQYSRLLQQTPGITPERKQEAVLREGVALIRTGKGAAGEKILRSLASSPLSEAGSEAAVALGEYLLSERRLADAEKILTTFTDSGTPHDYWLARGYITLADVYAAKGQKSTAKEYIRSLKENYPGNEEDIERMISSRLNNWK